MTTNKERLNQLGMHPDKVRELDDLINTNRRVVVINNTDNGMYIHVSEKKEIGSLEVIEL